LTVDAMDELKSLLQKSGISMESRAAEQLTLYLALLTKWNSRVNLTARSDWTTIGPLFREGIWASGFLPASRCALLDIGSGAGFPAIILRILAPGVRLEMIESRAKRAAFLETAASELGLEGTLVHSARLDEHLGKSARTWDYITWKGLRIKSSELLQLRDHSHGQTQFWMFHGRELAVEDAEAMGLLMKRVRSEKCPGRENWTLSMYIPR